MAQRAAVLDVGTNTVRLLVADCADDGLTPVLDRTNMSRLGLGASADGTLAAESIARTADEAIALVREARAAGATTILIVGTAAVRDAPNRDGLLAWIERETGIACRVVDGETEASLTFLGATVGQSLDGTSRSATSAAAARSGSSRWMARSASGSPCRLAPAA